MVVPSCGASFWRDCRPPINIPWIEDETRRSMMNATAQRSMTNALAGGTPGPRPPPKFLSARALTALVNHLTTGYPNPDGPDEPPGPLDPYIRRALERSVI